MARELLNTLYVTTQGAYVHLDHQTIRVEVEDETKLRVPLHHLGSVVCFGRVNVSPAAMAKCAEEQRDLIFLSRSGRFRAKMVGPTSGNVLLRLAQHNAHQDQRRDRRHRPQHRGRQGAELQAPPDAGSPPDGRSRSRDCAQRRRQGNGQGRRESTEGRRAGRHSGKRGGREPHSTSRRSIT